jgi:hypothetical protein
MKRTDDTIYTYRRLLLIAASCCFGGNKCTHAFLQPTRRTSKRIQIVSENPSFTSNRYRIRHDELYDRSKAFRTRPLYNAATMPAISWWYLSLLALQFGCQPLLTKAYTPSNIVRSTVVLAQDFVRLALCCFFLVVSGSWKLSTQNWTMESAVLGAGIPSALYLIQNYCAIMAYQNLPPLTFNVLNQTKTLSAALCCFLVMGRIQSKLQVLSLFLLLASALVIAKVLPLVPWTRNPTEDAEPSPAKFSKMDNSYLTMGVIPILLASFISGLGTFSTVGGTPAILRGEQRLTLVFTFLI